MYSSIDKKAVLVTGAANGIGKGIALKFAELGAKVAIADLDEEKGFRALKEVRELGAEAIFIRMDLEKKEEVIAAVSNTVEAFGHLDILINNAATLGTIVPVLDIDETDWTKVIHTNVNGTFLLSQSSAKQMVLQGRGGCIINILTIQTGAPVPRHTAYVASKGALQALTLSMAVDLADLNIRVNGIEVGSVFTEGFRTVLPQKYRENDFGVEACEVPPLLDQQAATLLGRMGRPGDIAKVAAFLASEEASYLTGSLIRADGGRAISRKTEPLL